MMAIEAALERACDSVPGVVSGALVLVPERLVLGGIGVGTAMDREPLVRLASRLVSDLSVQPSPGSRTPFVEYAFVSEDQFVVVLRGRRFPQLALALTCARDVNLALVMSMTRKALLDLEPTLDASLWEA